MGHFLKICSLPGPGAPGSHTGDPIVAPMVDSDSPCPITY